MKLSIIAAATGCILISTACDTGGDGTLASCATPGLVGSFDGLYEGPIVAQLTAEGELTAIFSIQMEEGGDITERTATANVADMPDEGDLEPTSQGVAISGTFDFTSCSASGTWTYFGDDGGSWSIGLREPGIF